MAPRRGDGGRTDRGDPARKESIGCAWRKGQGLCGVAALAVFVRQSPVSMSIAQDLPWSLGTAGSDAGRTAKHKRRWLAVFNRDGGQPARRAT